MKNSGIFLLLFITSVVFSQEENLRGTLQIKKENADSCFVTILGSSKNESFLKKKELRKPQKIELNKECNNYKIVSYKLSYNQGGIYVSEYYLGDSLKLNSIKNAEELTNLYIENIIVKNINSDFTTKIPTIIFKIID